MNGFTMFLGEKSMICYKSKNISYKYLTESKENIIIYERKNEVFIVILQQQLI